jgi:hypothetical protein
MGVHVVRRPREPAAHAPRRHARQLAAGSGRIALPIPGDPGLVGTTLWTQWLHFSSSRLATSEALAVTTAAPGKPLDAAVITSADVPIGSAEPAVGRVNTGKLPVVRLHL